MDLKEHIVEAITSNSKEESKKVFNYLMEKYKPSNPSFLLGIAESFVYYINSKNEIQGDAIKEVLKQYPGLQIMNASSITTIISTWI